MGKGPGGDIWIRTGYASRRTSDTGRRRHAALRIHRQRSDELDETVDCTAVFDEKSRARERLRVRLPRGELLHQESPLRRPRRGTGDGSVKSNLGASVPMWVISSAQQRLDGTQ